jgi:hypothetical protein
MTIMKILLATEGTENIVQQSRNQTNHEEHEEHKEHEEYPRSKGAKEGSQKILAPKERRKVARGATAPLDH